MGNGRIHLQAAAPLRPRRCSLSLTLSPEMAEWRGFLPKSWGPAL